MKILNDFKSLMKEPHIKYQKDIKYLKDQNGVGFQKFIGSGCKVHRTKKELKRHIDTKHIKTFNMRNRSTINDTYKTQF